MRIILALFSILICTVVVAEDGLSVQFTIEEKVLGSHSVQSYTNSILMKFNESAKFEFKNIYNVKFTSRTLEEKINLVVTLHDWIDGKPYYVGAKSIDIVVGSDFNFELEKYGRSYKLNIDTSFGILPQ